MKPETLSVTAILAFVLAVFLFPLEALGQDQQGKKIPHRSGEAGLAPEIARCESSSSPDMLNRGVLGHWTNPRLNMTCQYGAFCPSTYCTTLRSQCSSQGGSYTETFIGKCCASPSDSSYARFVCVRKEVVLIDQYCRY